MIKLTNKEAIAITERIAKTTNEGSPADVLDAMKVLDPVVNQFFARSSVKEATPNWDRLRDDMQKAHTVEVVLALGDIPLTPLAPEELKKECYKLRNRGPKNECPKFEKKSPWIPADSDIKPAHGDKVLVMWIDKSDNTKFSGTHFYMGDFKTGDFEGLAWMPIPEYEGEVR